MSELAILLQRIQPPQAKPLEGPPEPSDALKALFTRIGNRQWKGSSLSWAYAFSEELADQLAFIRHTRKCGQCQAELMIDIERYGGRCCPWYLNLEYETGWYPEVYKEDPLYADAPRLDKYRIGSYWTGSSEDTRRFIFDRMKWAEQKIQTLVEALTDFIVQLEEWDLGEESCPALEVDDKLESLLNLATA